MTVTYYLRKRTHYYSIERVFETVIRAMPTGVSAETVYCRYARGGLRRLYNIAEARGRQSDINHITGDIHYVALALDPKRMVLTIHDCGSLERLSGWRREMYRLFWFEWPVRRAAAVTVISDYTKTQLLRFTSCPEEKISVIPNPIPQGFEPFEKPRSNGKVELLQVGAFPNKNVENVVRALKGLPCRLTIVGHLSEDQSSLLKETGLEYSSVFDLSDNELQGTYRRADIVVFCSTYEGFGLPLIEANCVGRPVVTSDIEPLRSIAGGAACLVNPNDVQSIRAGVLRVMEDARYREELVRRGFANAARYSAERIASLYVEIYKKVLIAAQSRPDTSSS